ncbi:cytosolic carboxypeptidase 4 isoform X1 [Erpetoichthys calabaricus]|uniref:cytosolic carboxypeptidase 4 isoform X1 n=2 Tax=Erpetoichthys calabaricus TaxID=27687 RepID=UPI0022346741|nr:cytosolic carboxypeptidase 4 isoform X1 [Erpetoichthys calabaricus]
MFNYSKYTNFTWRENLKDWGHLISCGKARLSMAGSAASGLEVLLSTLQNSNDNESTLNILNVLDELLSAGTDRRIYYMISKGGSEALLRTLVSSMKRVPPNDIVLLPLMQLLAKVGHRDRKIGHKAEEAEAVHLTLSLLRRSLHDQRRATACLWVLRVFASCVSTAVLLGKEGTIELLFKLIPKYNLKQTHTIKATIDALAALLNSKTNSRHAVDRGYVTTLIKLFEDWHYTDLENQYVPLRRSLLHCLRHITNIRAGKKALFESDGISILYRTTQDLLGKRGVELLVISATQIMRKCYPKCPLPLPSSQSVYSFPVPGRPESSHSCDSSSHDGNLEDEIDEEQLENEELDTKEEDEDLETDLRKLCTRPEPDRTRQDLKQYERFFPELQSDFKDVDRSEEASFEVKNILGGNSEKGLKHSEKHSSGTIRNNCSSHCGSSEEQVRKSKQTHRSCETTRTAVSELYQEARSFHSPHLITTRHEMLSILLERHQFSIPGHDPEIYTNFAAMTKSIAGYSLLAFPDFWGHLPLPYQQSIAQRNDGVQRKKVFEDIQRLLNPGDIIDKVVFDLETPSLHYNSEDSESLCFFSRFESGNLRKAIQIRRFEYDLILNSDVNCSQHHQWFYFEVSGMKAGMLYCFNIINCEKTNSQFNYGMQPVLYSVQEALQGRPHWVREGNEVCYYKNHFSQPSSSKGGQKGLSFYSLSFTVIFPHNDDVCYLAYHYPYTYTALQTQLQLLKQSLDPEMVFFRHQTLCNTLNGNPCPVITITACPRSQNRNNVQQFRNRPYVVLTARVHPGESNASWVMKGTLEFLCSNDPAAMMLRETYIFKIIPMLNPDGVINGTHRCSLTGEDLNRQWMKPDINLSPTIYHCKGLLSYLNGIGKAPIVFCDYHGHSRKKNVFLYGCSIKETLWQSGTTASTTTVKEDPGYRTLPKILDRIAPAFAFNSCNFLVEKSRQSTARVVVWKEIGVLRSYTMESTYCGFDQGVYKGFQIGTRELEEMGAKFCQSLLVLSSNLLHHDKKLTSHIPAALDLDDPIRDQGSYSILEDDEPPCVEEIDYHSDGCSDHEWDGGDFDTEVYGAFVDFSRKSKEEDKCQQEKNGLNNSKKKMCFSSKPSQHLPAAEPSSQFASRQTFDVSSNRHYLC